MRYVLLFLSLFFSSIYFAQKDSSAIKTKDNCIGIYTGVSLFHNFEKIGNSSTNFYMVGGFFDPLIFLKHKKHEFICGPTITSNNIAGETFSYLYHFSKKRTNLFIEANLKNIWYSANDCTTARSYNQAYISNGVYSIAKVMVLAAHIAPCFEFKIFKFLSGQLAVGVGYFWVNPKPGYQVPNYNPLYNNYDPYNTKAKDNFYKNHFGFDWYARLGLTWRIYNF